MECDHQSNVKGGTQARDSWAVLVGTVALWITRVLLEHMSKAVRLLTRLTSFKTQPGHNHPQGQAYAASSNGRLVRKTENQMLASDRTNTHSYRDLRPQRTLSHEHGQPVQWGDKQDVA